MLTTLVTFKSLQHDRKCIVFLRWIRHFLVTPSCNANISFYINGGVIPSCNCRIKCHLALLSWCIFQNNIYNHRVVTIAGNFIYKTCLLNMKKEIIIACFRPLNSNIKLTLRPYLRISVDWRKVRWNLS